MKKLIPLLLFATTLSFVSCGNSNSLSQEEIEAIAINGYKIKDAEVLRFNDEENKLADPKTLKELDLAFFSAYLQPMSNDTVSFDADKAVTINIPFEGDVYVDYVTTEKEGMEVQVIYCLFRNGDGTGVIIPTQDMIWSGVRDEVISKMVDENSIANLTDEGELALKAFYYISKKYAQLAYNAKNLEINGQSERVFGALVWDR